MANVKLSQLPAAGAAPATGDRLAGIRISDTTDVTWTIANLFTSPSLTTPTIGVATATTVNKVTLTAPATGSTLTIADGKTLTASNTLTLAGTDGTTITFPSTSATVARTDAANTFTGHQTIEGVTSTGATGTGKFVFDNTPTLVTPVLGAATGTSVTTTGTLYAFSATAIPAGGTAGSGFKFSSTSNFGLFFGSGAPTLSAAQGSMYLRSDGTPYYNTDGSTTWTAVGGGSGSGDVVGPGSATDNAICRFDSTTGKLIQNSAVTVADTTGDISTPGSISTGVGGSTGGTVTLTEGSAPSLTANAFQIYAPVDVAAGGLAFVLPGTAGSGVLTVTNSSGTMTIATPAALTVANGGTGIASGTSGGVPYYSGSTTIASSAALAANALVIGGGAGAAPATTTTGTGVVTQLGLAANGSDVDAIGFRGVPQNSQSAAYTTVMADNGKCIFHPSSDANARTFTIDSNANVAYEVGSVIEFVNMSANNVTIAITSDTLRLLPAGTTGSRTLAQYGKAVAEKIASTEWVISGNSALT